MIDEQDQPPINPFDRAIIAGELRQYVAGAHVYATNFRHCFLAVEERLHDMGVRDPSLHTIVADMVRLYDMECSETSRLLDKIHHLLGNAPPSISSPDGLLS